VPHLDSVLYKPIVDNDVRVVNIKTGEMDVISNVPPKDVEDLQNTPGVVMRLITGTFWPHVGVNCQREPFNDVRVRQAVHFGLDRPEINELAYFGQNTLTESPIPPSNPFYNKIDTWPYDPDKAKALLAEAGYPDGVDVTMRVIKGNPATEPVQAQLKKIGINIEVNEVEASEWFSEVFEKRDFWITIVAHGSKIDPHLSLYDIQHSGEAGTKNYCQFWDDEMDEVLEAGATTTDFEERKKAYFRAQEILVERSGYIVLGVQPHRYAHQDYVENFTMLGPGDLRWWDTKVNK
jgi:peptide/nickel transport system substrate-binding protein